MRGTLFYKQTENEILL